MNDSLTPATVDGPPVGPLPQASDSRAENAAADGEARAVLRDLSPRLLPRRISPMRPPLIFPCPPDTLHRRGVIAIALPAPGGDPAELPPLFLIGVGTLWGTTVGGVEQARAGAVPRVDLPSRESLMKPES